ncbi:MAG: nitroreductase family protein, partial [Anaerolineae bacterium]|nr:nitroreductase family protein [Anaerolineae bacterium]
YKTRSYRRFDQSVTASLDTLRELVDLARHSAAAANRQPLKYILVSDTATCARVFPHTRWAGALPDWGGPAEGERPTAYIAILLDTEINKSPGHDAGIAAQSIMLGATEKGLGGCMLGAIDRPKLCEVLQVPERYEITLLLALGKPVETVVITDLEPGGSINYYRDPNQVHYVPKRTMNELILSEF